MTTYNYDATGNMTSSSDPNGIQTQMVFDPLNRLTQICEAGTTPACSAGTPLENYNYNPLGVAGNRTSVMESPSGRTVLYGYDPDYRLTSEAISGDPGGQNGAVNYTNYDAVGNRLTMTSSLGAVPGGSFFYNQNDELTGDTYDANGNTVSSAGIASTYDFENHMLTHGAVAMVYDGDGNRVSETVGGVTTKFLVDDLNPTHLPQVLDEIVGGSVTRTYAYGLQRISEDQQISGAWTPSFYGYDGHGNVRFLTNSAGTITDSYTYDAFGMPITTSGTTPNNFLYSGEQFDGALGAYYLRARYFNSATGRFLTMDPRQKTSTCYSCGRSTTNSYTYASANPVNRIDPRGLADVLEEEEITKETVLVVHPVVWGTYAVAVACLLSKDVSYFIASLQDNGPPTKQNPCLYRSNPLPHIPAYGDRPAPFDPEDVVTAPGSPWDCDPNMECEAPCPEGSPRDYQKLRYDPGTYGEPPHWDWTDCDGNTWKIYLDGTMGPG